MLPSLAMCGGVRQLAVTHSVRPKPSRIWIFALWSYRNLSNFFLSSIDRLSPPEKTPLSELRSALSMLGRRSSAS